MRHIPFISRLVTQKYAVAALATFTNTYSTTVSMQRKNCISSLEHRLNNVLSMTRRYNSTEGSMDNNRSNSEISNKKDNTSAVHDKNDNNNVNYNNNQSMQEKESVKRNPLSMMASNEVNDEEETHPDFQPRIIASDLAEDEVAMIKKDMRDTIKEEDIVVFIKGVPEAPMCAFSKRIIDVLEVFGVEYTSFDVLAHPVVRSYVKELSEWPTIPQLFIKGEFVGGMDIVMKMTENGQLEYLFTEKGIKHRELK